MTKKRLKEIIKEFESWASKPGAEVIFSLKHKREMICKLLRHSHIIKKDLMGNGYCLRCGDLMGFTNTGEFSVDGCLDIVDQQFTKKLTKMSWQDKVLVQDPFTNDKKLLETI